MKIAAVSEDEVNISQHFGRAPYYVVLTVEGNEIVDSETRPKVGHHTFAAHEHPRPGRGQRHGCDAGSQPKHRRMAETIADCDVLIAGGMGQGAYESLKDYGIRPIVTEIGDIREAILRYLEGNLPNLRERLH
ncbi:MAG: NifB/NifX family molybdenum-iron cluster-binding protein [Dehalococcoidia bacterium]|nr:MAG: NifB/NifX family molybdenum-iron cluster-binding protein [Dehalococcoidia bacterium]